MTAQDAMSQPVISVTEDTPLDDLLSKMEEHQIRRLPVVDANGACCGIVSQADVALAGKDSEVGEMVREVSRDAILN
jgi:CBS domain-containing protein